MYGHVSSYFNICQLYNTEIFLSRFNNKRELTAHMKYHELKTEFHCKDCDMCYKSKLSLKKHLSKTHNVAYACNVCDKTFKNMRKLNTHKHSEHRNTVTKRVKLPTDQLAISTRVKCRFCDKQFCNRYVLSKHLMRKHSFSSDAMKTLLRIRDKGTVSKFGDAVKEENSGSIQNKDNDEKNFKVYYKDDEMAVFVKMGNPKIDQNWKSGEKDNTFRDNKSSGRLLPKFTDPVTDNIEGRNKNKSQAVQVVFVDKDKSTSIHDCDKVSDKYVVYSDDVGNTTTINETVVVCDEHNESSYEEVQTISNSDDRVYIVLSGENESLTNDQSGFLDSAQVMKADQEQILVVLDKDNEVVTVDGEDYVLVSTENEESTGVIASSKIQDIVENYEIIYSDQDIHSIPIAGKSKETVYENNSSHTNGHEKAQALIHEEQRELYCAVEELSKPVAEHDTDEQNKNNTEGCTMENNEEITESISNIANGIQEIQTSDYSVNKSYSCNAALSIYTPSKEPEICESETQDLVKTEGTAQKEQDYGENGKRSIAVKADIKEDLERFEQVLKHKASQFGSVEEYNNFLDKMIRSLQKAKMQSHEHF